MNAGEIVFETARLRIRTATSGDVEHFCALWTHPRVMRNVGFPQGLRITKDEIRALIEKPRDSEFERRLVVVRKDTGDAIGEACLHRPKEDGVAGTDVKLFPHAWGNRFGVEVKQGLLNHLFTHTDCRAVRATPNVDNVASIRMQEAVGGVRVGEGVFEFPEEMRDYTCPVRHYVYEVTRAAWARPRS